VYFCLGVRVFVCLGARVCVCMRVYVCDTNLHGMRVGTLKIVSNVVLPYLALP